MINNVLCNVALTFRAVSTHTIVYTQKWYAFASDHCKCLTHVLCLRVITKSIARCVHVYTEGIMINVE